MIYDILEKGFFMERNWWNICFDNWVNHSYLANMYVCSTTWLKITINHSSDIFFCNFPWFFPSASKTLKTILPQSNRKSFSKKISFFCIFLLFYNYYYLNHTIITTQMFLISIIMRKNKKRNKFFSVNVNPKKCEKGSILFFANRDFSTKKCFLWLKTRMVAHFLIP